jgi:predicted site-specific integrase-resolvase
MILPDTEWNIVRQISMNVNAAAEATGVSRASLYRLMRSGAIEHRKVRGRTVILTESLINYIERQPGAALRAPKAA